MSEIASERLVEGYEPRFDVSAAVGRQGELFIADIIETLKDGSVEVKKDDKAKQTGNVYIEYLCWSQKTQNYELSGIATTQADVWAIVLGSLAICVPTEIVKAVTRRALREGRGRGCNLDPDHPSRGAVIPFGLFVSYCIEAAENS